MIKYRVEFEDDVLPSLLTGVAEGTDPISPSIEGSVERHVAQFVPASARIVSSIDLQSYAGGLWVDGDHSDLELFDA